MEAPALFAGRIVPWHDYYLLAGTAATTLMGLLFVSLLMLSPGISRRPLATAMLAIGVMRLAMIVPGIRHSLADVRRGAGFSRGYVLGRSVIPIMAYASMGLAGWTLLKGNPGDGLIALMSSTVLLIADAARCSWDVLVRVGRLARGAHPK